MPELNRRAFLQTLSAATFAPALPGISPAAVATPVGHNTMQFVWASYYAQMNNACSVAEITSALGVSPAVAESLFSQLIARNILAAPGITGVSTVAQPMMRDMRIGGMRNALAAANRPIRFDPAKLMERITRNIERECRFPTRFDDPNGLVNGDPGRT